MPEFQLLSEPLLGGYSEEFDGTKIEEVSNLAIVSIACPVGGGKRLRSAVSKAWNIDLPSPGTTEASDEFGITLMFMATDMYFALFPRSDLPPVERVAGKLGEVAYYTDQSDNWVALRLSGTHSADALERICPIDVSPRSFPAGSATRTVMEHMGSVVYCESELRYLLLSASSSADSFLHAVETSVKYVT